MSSDESLDPRLIEQTKQQIRSLVAEIAQLAKSEVSPEEFYGQFLPRVISALAALGGAVWTTNEEGRLGLQYQVNLQETHLREKTEEEQIQHSRLLYQVLSEGQGTLVPAHAGAGGDGKAGNPTDCLLVFGVLKTELEVLGLVEIFQRSDAGPAAQKGYLRFLAQMCDLAGEFLKSRQLRHFSDRQTLWTQLEDFTHAVHESLDPGETAFTIANEGRRLIQCDRLSVAVRKGRKCVIRTISGQDVFDSRSNTVRLLGRLATAVVASGDAVWYTGDTKDLAPQVEEAVQAYVDEAHSKTVAVLPLRRPRPAEEEEAQQQTEPPPPVGALIVEQIEDSRIAPSMVQRVEVVCRHSSTALANALEHQSLFLMPLWRLLGKSRVVVAARNLPKTVSISLLVLAVLACLALWPADFTVQSKGTLEPVERREVFAPANATVTMVQVEHGSQVRQDDPLVQLRDDELDSLLMKNDRERADNAVEIARIDRELVVNRDLTDGERKRLEGQKHKLQTLAKFLELDRRLLTQRDRELDIRSPIDGVVVTWDPQNRLRNRPVQRGQSLLRVADPGGDWQLELPMPENRVGHLVKAQQALAAAQPGRTGPQQEPAKPEQETAKPPQETAEGPQGPGSAPKEPSRVPQEPASNPEEQSASSASPGDSVAGTSPPKRADRLKVEFQLATDPGRTFEGTVEEVQHSAEVRGEEGNTVLVKVAIDKTKLPHPRPGAGVTAKVYCGRRPIGYVWFHDLLEFVQTRIIFRYL